ncbi:thioredoxin domain-containing protein [Blastomonas sp. AAP53]|uniref:thioredoxin domain-containing protein n=1 Tax=Blastomonas sp. AAP53 TaxID=1248760 RepID=UPI0002F3AC8C|nr:thioredoxin domain-containing protein [Blastomonas sp. AAP53]
MKRIASLIALPLMLSLAACGGEADTAAEGATKGEPIAAIPAPAGKNWAETVTKTDKGYYVLGNPEAPIKLVEYASLTCSHCADFAETAFATIRDKYVASGRVSFELRNFVREPLDLTASMLTRCGPDESYFALTEQVLANQADIFTKAQAMGQQRFEAVLALPDNQRYVALAEGTGLTDFFAQRGISRDQANQCLTNIDSARALADNTGTATREDKIQGTPTFFLNGRQVEFTGWPALETEIQAMGAR